ncbi:uncharacterized protein LOC131052160 [Cryptomeria japonica]|uniref:uncharacterized protein LOC131052160 n=1 Tax=Cryptomeria japonica TaxID=3369 RepID=UPI0027DA7A6F|nr:uncharacterized protein LOC131052160 [Cryptomeria japonica]
MPPPNPNVVAPPKPTQLPAQPMPNSKNKQPQQQQVYAMDLNQYHTYVVSISDIHLRFGTTLLAPSPPVIIEMPDEGHIYQSVKNSPIPSRLEQQESSNIPPFPQRLEAEPTKQKEEPIFDIMDQLKNICVKIPLFQAIKDVPIYGKAIKEGCLKNLGRKEKDPPTVHVVGQLADLVFGKFSIPKYLDPGSSLVAVVINGVQLQNALIDLGTAINVMTKDMMQKLNITNLRTTTSVLQLAYSSTVTPDGMVEDLVVTLDSWEYPADFVILSPKETLGGYPIILVTGRTVVDRGPVVACHVAGVCPPVLRTVGGRKASPGEGVTGGPGAKGAGGGSGLADGVSGWPTGGLGGRWCVWAASGRCLGGRRCVWVAGGRCL